MSNVEAAILEMQVAEGLHGYVSAQEGDFDYLGVGHLVDLRLVAVNQPLGAPPYEDLRGRSVEVKVRGTRLRVASLDDLISLKRASGRPQDLRDIADLANDD